MDLSMFDIEESELIFFAHIYNNPLNWNLYFTEKTSIILHKEKYIKLSKKLDCITPIIKSLENSLSAKKILVLFDLNGTLLTKSKLSISAERSCDLHGRTYKFYLRPGYNDFLRKILSHPRSIVGICSSMMYKTIKPIREILIGDPSVEDFKDQMLEPVFDRYYTRKDFSSMDKFASTRDLKKVWAHKALEGKFGLVNTLLIDSDPKKARFYRQNWLQTIPYDSESVISNMPNNTYYMNALADYIVNLLDNADNIPEYLKKNPFIIDKVKLNQKDLEFLKIMPSIKPKPLPDGEIDKNEDEKDYDGVIGNFDNIEL